MEIRIKLLPSISRAPTKDAHCCCCGKAVEPDAPRVRLAGAMAVVHPQDIGRLDAGKAVTGRWHADHPSETYGNDLGHHVIAHDCADRIGREWVMAA